MGNDAHTQNIHVPSGRNRENKTVTLKFDGFLTKAPREVVWTISLTLEEAILFADRNGDLAATQVLQKALEVTK